MSNVLELVADIPPSVNHYLQTRVIMKKCGNKTVPMPVVYETKEAKEYKKKFAKIFSDCARKSNWDKITGKYNHIYCDCIFYFDRTDKDCNNYFKILLDTITMADNIWEDDKTVCERVNAMYYDSENPRIELRIYPVEYIGIFNTQLELDNFENKCKTCNRYSRNCSILRKSKEGKITEEVNCLNCSKYKEKN